MSQQILVSNGLEALAEDHLFISVAKRDLAEALQLDLDDIEHAAATLLKDHQGHVTGGREHRPISIQREARNSLQSDPHV